jgi:co-chaperonin GroES (HSP10)
MFKLTAFLTTLLVSAGFMFAQVGTTHLMGTVTEIKADAVTIKMQDGKSEVVMLEKTTKFTKDEKPAKSVDLNVGDSVMIKAKMDTKMKMYTAEEVMLDAKDTKATTAPAKK